MDSACIWNNSSYFQTNGKRTFMVTIIMASEVQRGRDPQTSYRQ